METKIKPASEENPAETLVRIFGQDIPGSKTVYVGLTKIKGVSWSISNALCFKLGIDKRAKIRSLDKPTILNIEKSFSNLDIPDFIKNRRADVETGEHKHLLTNTLDIQKEFDIKRLKKIKSYRGLRHSLGLPTRGQRTRSHFRKRESAVGVKRKKE